jgi:hypothetical protein
VDRELAAILARLAPPGTIPRLLDRMCAEPSRVEQIWRLEDRDVLLVISDIDPADMNPERPHRPKVYRLQR